MISQEYSHDVRKILKWSFVLVIILALFLAVQTINAVKEYGTIGEDLFPNKTLSVTGEGEVFAAPDVAQFSFTVTEEADSVASAQGLVTEKIDGALAALDGLGIEEKDIKTTGYNAYPRYTYPEVVCMALNCPRSGERVLSGYEVSQTIEVKVRDTAQAGEVLSAVANSGVSNVSGLQFVIDDQEALKAEARQKAIESAEQKIESLARDLGVKIEGVVGFSEDSGDYYYQERAVMSSMGMGGDDMKEVINPQLPTGENTIRVRVYVTYEIR